jgi:hypothetical protein
MSYRLKGFIYGMIILVISTLVLAPMVLLSMADISSCDYFCSLAGFLKFYQNPFSILFILLNWFLGTRIAKLSYLLSGKEKQYRSETGKKYTWLWEHKVKKVEDA